MKNCGECQACCWFFPLAFLNKPMRTNCPHQCRRAAQFYNQERHSVCKTFLCEWLQRPEWGEELRPDKCGIMYQRKENLGNGRGIIQASQFSPYSWLRRENGRAIDQLVRAGNIVLRSYTDKETAEYRTFYDERRYPRATTRRVLDQVLQVNKEAACQQTAA